MARPTKYDPAMCEQVIELGRIGAGKAEIAAELDVTRDTVWRWTQEHPEFSDAMTRAAELSAGWWHAQGRKGIWSRDFNAPAYSLQVRNRFPGEWTDRKAHEHSGPEGQPITTIRRVIVDPGGDG